MIKRKKNESPSEYILRLLDLKKENLIDMDYPSIYELAIGKELSESEARKRTYGIRDIIEADEDFEMKLGTGRKYDKIIETKKERQKLQTLRAELNRNLRETARAEMLHDDIISKIEEIGIGEQLEIPKKIIPKNSNEEHLVVFSDAHFGTEFSVKDLSGKVINEYSPEVFERRMWQLYHEIIDYVKKENLTSINLMDCADSVDGMLHISQIASLRFGLIDQVINYSNFLAKWLNELSKHVYIDFYKVQGNHCDARLITNKKGDFPNENLSKVIVWYLETYLKQNPNICIHEHGEHFVYFNIVGYDILASHGDQKTFNVKFKDLTTFYGDNNIDYLITGHYHTPSSKEVAVGKYHLTVGSIMGANDYSTKKCLGSNASASIFSFRENYGLRNNLNIVLN